jgi:hypothetical protein
MRARQAFVLLCWNNVATRSRTLQPLWIRIAIRFSLAAAVGVFAAGLMAAATSHHRDGLTGIGAVHGAHHSVRRADPLLAVIRTPRLRRRVLIVRANFPLASRTIRFALNKNTNSVSRSFDDGRPHSQNDHFAQPRGPPGGRRA